MGDHLAGHVLGADCPCGVDARGRRHEDFSAELCRHCWKERCFIGSGWVGTCYGCASTHPNNQHRCCSDCGRRYYRTPPATPEQAACTSCGEAVQEHQGRVPVGAD